MTINEVSSIINKTFRDIPGKHPHIRLYNIECKAAFQVINEKKEPISFIYYITVVDDHKGYWKQGFELALDCTEAQIESSVVNGYYEFIEQCKKFGVVINIAN